MNPISVEEARERVLSYVDVLETETKPILEALGQVLAEDVRSNVTIPPLSNTAMDGYAVLAADTASASADRPVRLKVIGQVAAGAISQQTVVTGTAIRIMTGAPMPAGADAIVPFEETDEGRRATGGALLEMPEEVLVFKAARPGANVRAAGEDVRAGQLLMERGRVLRPAEIGVLASIGRATVAVVRRPVVAILATGDELVEPGEPLPPGKIFNSNSFSVAAQVLRAGGLPRMLGIARDTLEDLEQKIHQALEADLVLTSAGVSLGAYDIVKDVLAKEGEIRFWTVRMKPGKPLAFGAFPGRGRKAGHRVPHLGLPGNPVSAMVSFELLGRPAVLKMMGKTRFDRPVVQATMVDDAPGGGDRRFYLRVSVERRDGRYYATSTGPQGSGVLTSMLFGNGLAVISEGVTSVRAGSTVPVVMFDWPEEVDV